jgi:phosphopantothenoylcysteine decarboxylase/phosphopantothenate--cysteine ligase
MKNINISLKNKRILLGITGSIATYKAPSLVRDLQSRGAEVSIVATPSALRFVSELVLNNLTHNVVISDIFADNLQHKGAWHIELAHNCDLMIIAPCSATTLSKIAIGNADNPVSCMSLALPPQVPLIIAPAMDSDMYENIATQTNINLLRSRNISFIEPAIGMLASGLMGKGRLPDNDVIISVISACFNDFLRGINVLVTAGGTRERIDDVRFISNNSSGKMGYSIASVASSLGASVTPISSNVALQTPSVSRHFTADSSADMFRLVSENYADNDVIIMSAAVSDYTPADYFAGKIKKSGEDLVIRLKQTQDILKWISQNRKDRNRVVVGFALEDSNDISLARAKLYDKGCDLLVFNSLDSGSVFGSDSNKITILDTSGGVIDYDLMPKIDCARKILDAIKNKLEM